MSDSGKTCGWYLVGDEDDGSWEPTCSKNAFIFNDGGPEENGFKHCPYCGNKVEVFNPKDDDNDD